MVCAEILMSSSNSNSVSMAVLPDEEVEDLVGEVRYTDSQKSIVPVKKGASQIYASDFTDSSEERNTSSGKNTYVLESDSEDSERNYPVCEARSTVIVSDAYRPPVALNVSVQCTNQLSSRSACTSLQHCTIVAQESYTQTSKTIIQLAETEGMVKPPDNNTLQTQTSVVSITENKTVEYRIEVSSGTNSYVRRDFVTDFTTQIPISQTKFVSVTCNRIEPDPVHMKPLPDAVVELKSPLINTSDNSVPDKTLQFATDSKETLTTEGPNRRTLSDTDSLSPLATDFEEDSLMGNSPRRSVSEEYDISELRSRLSNKIWEEEMFDSPPSELKRFEGTLTPLTEESNRTKPSLVEITPDPKKFLDARKTAQKSQAKSVASPKKTEQNDVLFTSNNSMKVKAMSGHEEKKDSFKLPPIKKKNQSCPNSPHLSTLFNVNNNKLSKSGTLPCLLEKQQSQDRWEISSKNMASGESRFISGPAAAEAKFGSKSRSSSPKKESLQLPPIHSEGATARDMEKFDVFSNLCQAKTKGSNSYVSDDAISIQEKIKELKIITNKRLRSWSQSRKSERRSASPGSVSSPDDRLLCDRACDVLCSQLIKRLHSTSWHEVIKTLDEIPTTLDKYWHVMTEFRIADIIRQVCSTIESPRPQISWVACKRMADILKNTNYTKKPEFNEAMTLLLVKTGSASRQVRRAANVALDEIVCNVDLTAAVSALCVHGVGHKNALVRAAAARLLVVCSALASGGRDLLRARPASAATARRHALRALSSMLEDKSADTRKYAERLYSMLRPLSNFEAFYLNDVDAGTAGKQMKKYDQLLLGSPSADEDR